MVYHRPAFRIDIIEHYVYLAQEAGQEVADRFLANAEASFALLSMQPMIGAPLTLRHPELTEMRKWPVEAFENS